MSAAVQAPPVINPKLIVPFVNSVRDVFSTMVKVATSVERPHLKEQPSPSYDVSGVIGFSGGIVGSVVVSFQKDAAMKMVEGFAGVPLEFASPDFADAIGELTNMIVGRAKKDMGAIANISIPNVVIGANHIIARLSDVPTLVIPCRTPVGDFAVEVNIRKTEEK